MMHVGDLMSTMGVFSAVGDTILCNLSTVWEYHDTCGGYHEYRWGCSVPWGTQITKDSPHGTEHPHGTHDIPHRTEHPPQYSR